jgi:hypothetical protein
MSTNLYFSGFKKIKKLNPKALENARKNKIIQPVTPLQRALSELYTELKKYLNDKNSINELMTEIANLNILTSMNIELLANVLIYLRRNNIENISELNSRNFNSIVISKILDSLYERKDEVEINNKRLSDFARYVFTVLEYKRRTLENATLENPIEIQSLIAQVIATKEKKYDENVEPRF